MCGYIWTTEECVDCWPWPNGSHYLSEMTPPPPPPLWPDKLLRENIAYIDTGALTWGHRRGRGGKETGISNKYPCWENQTGDDVCSLQYLLKHRFRCSSHAKSRRWLRGVSPNGSIYSKTSGEKKIRSESWSLEDKREGSRGIYQPSQGPCWLTGGQGSSFPMTEGSAPFLSWKRSHRVGLVKAQTRSGSIWDPHEPEHGSQWSVWNLHLSGLGFLSSSSHGGASANVMDLTSDDAERHWSELMKGRIATDQPKLRCRFCLTLTIQDLSTTADKKRGTD